MLTRGEDQPGPSQSLEGHPDNGERDEQHRSRFCWGDALGLRASLAEDFDLSFHFWPMEAVLRPGEGVVGSQVALEGMREGKVHKDIDLGLWNHLEVTQLPQ